jgi:hypothetical protein
MLDFDDVLELAIESEFGLGNGGVCLACGAEADGCEPDARNYTCDNCGEDQVFGASEALLGGLI